MESGSGWDLIRGDRLHEMFLECVWVQEKERNLFLESAAGVLSDKKLKGTGVLFKIRARAAQKISLVHLSAEINERRIVEVIWGRRKGVQLEGVDLDAINLLTIWPLIENDRINERDLPPGIIWDLK